MIAAAGQAMKQKNPGAVVSCVRQLDWMTGSGFNVTTGQRSSIATGGENAEFDNALFLVFIECYQEKSDDQNIHNPNRCNLQKHKPIDATQVGKP